MVFVHDWQVSESLSYHQIERISRTGISLCAQRILCHDLRDCDIPGLDSRSDNPKGKVLRSENAGNTVVIVCNQHTILAFCCHQLCSLCHCNVRLDLKCLAWLESKDGTWRSLAARACSSCCILTLAKIGFCFLANSLQAKYITSYSTLE